MLLTVGKLKLKCKLRCYLVNENSENPEFSALENCQVVQLELQTSNCRLRPKRAVFRLVLQTDLPVICRSFLNRERHDDAEFRLESVKVGQQTSTI